MKTETIHKIGKGLLKHKTTRHGYYQISMILSFLISDKVYTSILYLILKGKLLSLNNPQSFNEKIQWLKLNNRNSFVTQVADKYGVRDYVKEKGLEDILIPLINVYNAYDEINFDELPDQFILKATHGSGWNVICNNKNSFDQIDAKEKIELWLRTNYYYTMRSWEYKNIPPKVICEEFISSKNNVGLDDYKIYCFNGKPTYIQYITDRYNGQTSESFYDFDWNLQEFVLTFNQHKELQPKPSTLETMFKIAQQLSEDLDYARVDLYDCNGKVYFGEITLHPTSGFDSFNPTQYDLILGEKLLLTR